MKIKKYRKPRVGFCWECGRRLRSAPGGGKHYVEIEVDGHKRIIHVECAIEYKCMAENNGKCNTNWSEITANRECNGTDKKCHDFLSHYMTKGF